MGVMYVLSIKAACPEQEVKISVNFKEYCGSYCAYRCSKGLFFFFFSGCNSLQTHFPYLQFLYFLHIAVRNFSHRTWTGGENTQVSYNIPIIIFPNISRTYYSGVLQNFNLLFMKQHDCMYSRNFFGQRKSDSKAQNSLIG